MCGLNGVYGSITKKEKTAFSLLQMFSQMRGRDSTGVGLVHNNKKKPAQVYKTVGGQESLVLEFDKVFDQFNWELSAFDLRCIVGHNRWATVGEVNDKNAHPFQHKNVIGTHNGTIPLYELSHCTTHAWNKSDSQVLIEELGEGKDIAEIVKHVKGAWALVWYDETERRLHMARNKERTLFVTKSTDEKTLFWASEGWMLTLALARSGVKHDDIHAVVVDRHLTWKIKGDGKIFLDNVEEAIGDQPKPVKDWSATGRWFDRREPRLLTVVPSATYGKGPPNIIPIRTPVVEEDDEYEEDYVNTFGMSYVSRRRFEALTKDGCANCTGDIVWGDRDNIVWIDPESPCCMDCAEYLTGKKETH